MLHRLSEAVICGHIFRYVFQVLVFVQPKLRQDASTVLHVLVLTIFLY